jgi:hypothetical protein
MARPSIGEVAMSGAERMRRHRQAAAEDLDQDVQARGRVLSFERAALAAAMAFRTELTSGDVARQRWPRDRGAALVLVPRSASSPAAMSDPADAALLVQVVVDYLRSLGPISAAAQLFQQSEWVSYDNPESLGYKTAYVNAMGLGGAMVWSIDDDDFANGYPLLRVIVNILNNPALGPQLPTGLQPSFPATVGSPPNWMSQLPDTPGPYAVKWTVAAYLAAGISADKIVLGMPTYGRGYMVANPGALASNSSYGQPFSGPSLAGPATQVPGVLAYYEIAQQIAGGALTYQFELAQRSIIRLSWVRTCRNGNL